MSLHLPLVKHTTPKTFSLINIEWYKFETVVVYYEDITETIIKFIKR